MKAFAIIGALLIVLTYGANAFPGAPIKGTDLVIAVAKKGSSARSAKSGRFVTRIYANKHKSTTVMHGKY